MLGKALKAGVQKGRLMFAKHQPKNGGKNYRLVTKPNRRKVLAKWSRHKKSVEYKDVDDFGKVSGRGSRRQEKNNPIFCSESCKRDRRGEAGHCTLVCPRHWSSDHPGKEMMKSIFFHPKDGRLLILIIATVSQNPKLNNP